jgi:4a-hydroxytetrahydrobiopterin dehydratase
VGKTKLQVEEKRDNMEWTKEQYENNKERLVRTFHFGNFIEAWAFMSKVAILAEKHNHHPDWSNIYNRVTIRLNTHDAGDVITDKDHKLAEAIDQV